MSLAELFAFLFVSYLSDCLWNCAWFRYLTLQEQVYMQTIVTLSLEGKKVQKSSCN